MPKKTQAKKVKKTAPKTKVKATKPKLKGMWKILEFKTAQRKASEQDRSNGRVHGSDGHSFQPHKRDPHFIKFAGPRRKVG